MVVEIRGFFCLKRVVLGNQVLHMLVETLRIEEIQNLEVFKPLVGDGSLQRQDDGLSRASQTTNALRPWCQLHRGNTLSLILLEGYFERLLNKVVYRDELLCRLIANLRFVDKP